jgi:hypothetical protein
MSEIEVDIDTLEMTELRVLSALQTGQNPGAVSSLLKLRVSEIRQAVTRLGVEVTVTVLVEPVRIYSWQTRESRRTAAVFRISRPHRRLSRSARDHESGLDLFSSVVPGRCAASKTGT